MKNKIKKYIIGWVNWIDNILDTWKHEPNNQQPIKNIYETI